MVTFPLDFHNIHVASHPLPAVSIAATPSLVGAFGVLGDTGGGALLYLHKLRSPAYTACNSG